jgi:hypothetical protein
LGNSGTGKDFHREGKKSQVGMWRKARCWAESSQLVCTSFFPLARTLQWSLTSRGLCKCTHFLQAKHPSNV